MYSYLIVGNSAGGVGAIEAIREIDSDSTLALVSDESCLAYSRPAVAEVLAGTKSVEHIAYRDESFYKRRQVDLYLDCPVGRIDVGRRQAELSDGRVLPFEKLLIAVGGAPIMPPIEGYGREGVYSFTTLADALALRSRLNSVGRRVVVIGAGLIGSACSDALVRFGAQVTMVEMRERVLSLLLDEEGSDLALTAMEAAGVSVLCNCTVERVIGRTDDDMSVGGVILDDGRRIACDAVVVAIGVRPRLELAVSAGLAVNRGIIVDERMETSVTGIYACGDVAEAYDCALEGNRVVPIWPRAFLGGRVAGLNMAGGEATCTDSTTMNTIKYFGLSMVSAGEVGAEDVPPVRVLRSKSTSGSYRKIVLRDNRIIGFTFAGKVDSAGVVYALLRGQVNVGTFANRLIGEEFDLAHLPRDLRLSHYRSAVAREARQEFAWLRTLAHSSTPDPNGRSDAAVGGSTVWQGGADARA